MMRGRRLTLRAVLAVVLGVAAFWIVWLTIIVAYAMSYRASQ